MLDNLKMVKFRSQGKFVFANRCVQKGNLLMRKIYGNGELIFSDNSKYIGEFRNNCIQGRANYEANYIIHGLVTILFYFRFIQNMKSNFVSLFKKYQSYQSNKIVSLLIPFTKLNMGLYQQNNNPNDFKRKKVYIVDQRNENQNPVKLDLEKNLIQIQTNKIMMMKIQLGEHSFSEQQSQEPINNKYEDVFYKNKTDFQKVQKV
ncbi:unnamed protein product [Paramecium sonneborni]|uniref:Uncharacterized protein n=1 Tax=Paramecium sonneborni TaxID=65129 RepID=A0A8S1QVP8_9CILI|nr:unnamed protein product [Paramecium sonneborni]